MLGNINNHESRRKTHISGHVIMFGQCLHGFSLIPITGSTRCSLTIPLWLKAILYSSFSKLSPTPLYTTNDDLSQWSRSDLLRRSRFCSIWFGVSFALQVFCGRVLKVSAKTFALQVFCGRVLKVSAKTDDYERCHGSIQYIPHRQQWDNRSLLACTLNREVRRYPGRTFAWCFVSSECDSSLFASMGNCW